METVIDNKYSGFLCLAIAAKFRNIQVPQEMREDFRDCEDVNVQILRTAKKLDMKAALGKMKLKKVEQMSFPVIARYQEGPYILLLAHKDNTWAVLNPVSGVTETLSDEDLTQKLTEDFIFVGGKKGKGADDGENFGFRWFLPTIWKYRRMFLCVLLAAFFLQILGILTPLMTQVVVDKVLTHNALDTLKTIAIGILIVYVYELLFHLCKNYLFVHTTNRIDVTLSGKLFRHLFGLPLKYFESRRVGETVARVRELEQIRSFLTGTPMQSLVDTLFIVVYIVVLFFYNVKMAFIVVISLPFFALLSLIITPLFKKRLDAKFEAGAKAQSFLIESITGIHTVKSFSLEDSFEEKWGDVQSEYVKAGYKTSMVAQTSNAIAGFIQHVFDLLILVVGAETVLAGKMTIGQLVAFRMLSGQVSGPVLRLVQLWQEYQQTSLSVKRIGDIFRVPVELASRTDRSTQPKVHGNIRFDNVRFRYRIEGADVLQNISFEIKENQIVGLVGRSGSGKSTISKLIQRLYIPQGGKISIDGSDVSLMNPHALRKQIGVVLQENFMFNGTVAENIAIHYPEASIEDIVEAAKIAGAHEFILELEQGYNTIIGEQGVSLSGGQKQRIAIARAIIHNPRILIFDEATSALDYESESIIQHNLKDICKGRTVLIIAHRLSTLSIADEIMVIDRGKMVEQGTHEELMKKDGLYASLYHIQFRGEVE